METLISSGATSKMFSDQLFIVIFVLFTAFLGLVIVFLLNTYYHQKVKINERNPNSKVVDFSQRNEANSPANGHQFSPPMRRPSFSYRIQEENAKAYSSEYTRRGSLWSKHASWHLPTAPRQSSNRQWFNEYYGGQGIEHVIAILHKYDVDVVTGFLPNQDPLQRLPYARYHLWEDLGDDLPKLLGARLGQAREPLRQLPILSTDKLVTDAELRRAHLLLCLFAHAYVWGGNTPCDVIPAGIAKPLVEVSHKLGIPPILGHPSIVLYNWRRLDIYGDICMENLSTLNNFFDGRDESWFYLITVEVEAKGALAIVPMMLAIDVIQRYNEEDMLREQFRRNNHNNNPSASTAATTVTATCSTSAAASNTAALAQQQQQQPIKQPQHIANMKYVVKARNHGIVDNGDDDDDDKEEETTSSDSNYDTGSDDYALPASPSSSNNNNNNHNKNNTEIIYTNEALVGALTVNRLTVYVTAQLQIVAKAIRAMTETLAAMREGCHPFIFYHRVRPFLSGWKHNPTMPKGVIYEGVNSNNEPLQYYGGSAAQSSLLPFLDITLGIIHESHKSREFLLAMRDYMLRPHREFLTYLTNMNNHTDNHEKEEEHQSCVHEFVMKRIQQVLPSSALEASVVASAAQPAPQLYTEEEKRITIELRDAYDACVAALQKFRTGHITLVSEYILAQQMNRTTTTTSAKGEGKADSLESSAGGKGTGGTDLMNFLKPIRDDCTKRIFGNEAAKKTIIESENVENGVQKVEVVRRKSWSTATLTTSTTTDSLPSVMTRLEDPNDIYYKDNGCSEDIDLFRGAARPSLKFSSKPLVAASAFPEPITTPLAAVQ